MSNQKSTTELFNELGQLTQHIKKRESPSDARFGSETEGYVCFKRKLRRYEIQ